MLGAQLDNVVPGYAFYRLKREVPGLRTEQTYDLTELFFCEHFDASRGESPQRYVSVPLTASDKGNGLVEREGAEEAIAHYDAGDAPIEIGLEQPGPAPAPGR